MNPNKYIHVIAAGFLLFSSLNGFGQVNIIKKVCTYDRKYSGSKLIIQYTADTIHIESGMEYWLDGFINLPDSSKLKIIGELLKFENDTALCCINVVNRSFNGIEGCRGKPNGVDRYTLQVDALFMINRICWPKLMELYSCTPVLYDTELKQDINTNPEKIGLVFSSYKQWYLSCKKDGVIPRLFPFNDGRYIWYGGRKSVTKNNIPILD